MAVVQRHAVTALTSEQMAATDPDREFAFSEADFRSLSQLAYEQAGIVLADSKKNLVYSRISRRLRALGLTSFRDYRTYLAAHPAETESFINSISTNLTKFFRESHHFSHLRKQIAIPFAQSSRSSGGDRLRIWSAGCSTGEEPYTIAVVLKREIADISRRDVKILATDIDTEVVARAARGEYPASVIEDLPKEYRPFFEGIGDDDVSGNVTLGHEVRSLITFRRLNLLGPWPVKGLFDAIFCRNVMIYFDGPTKATLIDRFTQQIKVGGSLYIGHSESLNGSHPGLELIGRTIYRRIA